MLTSTRIHVASLLLLSACVDSEPPDSALAPEPIGDMLRQLEGARGECSTNRLYRSGALVQYQCFDTNERFVSETRGTLLPSAEQELDAQLTSVDFDATEPVNYMGACGLADAHGIVTLGVEDERVSFDVFCPPEGVAELYGQLEELVLELQACEEPLAHLASIESGC